MSFTSQFILNLRYAFRLRKPILTFRLGKAVIRSYLFRRPPLRYVDFAINFSCNLKCKHCFAVGLRQPDRKKMTVSDYGRVARECMGLGAVNFSFQGGEPLVSEDLGAIIAACRPDRNVISVTTNGTLLSEDKLEELKQWGVDILTVSLDSGIAGEHDRFRGVPGSFDKTMAGIKRTLAKGLRVTIGTVVTHQNIRSEGVRRLVHLAGSLKIMMYFIFPVAAGAWKEQDDMFLTSSDLDYIYSLTRRSPYVRTDFQANFGGYGCGAAKEIIYLTPYGDVLTCPFLHVSPGNIFKESITKIRKRALENPFFSEYYKNCLVSTDPAFKEKYLKKTLTADFLPLPWDDVFRA